MNPQRWCRSKFRFGLLGSSFGEVKSDFKQFIYMFLRKLVFVVAPDLIVFPLVQRLILETKMGLLVRYRCQTRQNIHIDKSY